MDSSSTTPRPAERPPPTRRRDTTSRRPAVIAALNRTPHAALTVREIAERVDCADVTVRRHVAALRADGIIADAGIRPRTTPDGTRLPSRGENQYALVHRQDDVAA